MTALIGSVVCNCLLLRGSLYDIVALHCLKYETTHCVCPPSIVFVICGGPIWSLMFPIGSVAVARR